MLDFLYNIIISPLEQVIELAYLFVFRIFDNPAISIFGVSIAVSTFTLPMYFMAEKHQQNERDIQNRMRPVISNIRAVFSGDKRFMILSTYYRQNSYHPIYALRTSLSLFIQIPFFIAAFRFLSRLDLLQSIPFLFIKDLGTPDRLFSIGSLTINVLPILMTVINGISGTIYTKGFRPIEKIQLYGMALVFLVLLYNSPAGLVLYWTSNNLFSLVKNILQKTKNSKKIIYIVLLPPCLALTIFLFFVHRGALIKRLLVAFCCLAIVFLPFILRLFCYIKNKIKTAIDLQKTVLYQTRTFTLSVLILLVCAGLTIPSTVIASSVAEFSFLGGYDSPLHYVFITFFQSVGFFGFWSLSLFFLFSTRIRHGLTAVFSVFCFTSLINTFIFQANYGFLTQNLHFSDSLQSSDVINILNIIILILAACLILALLFTLKRRFFFFLQGILLLALLGIGMRNVIKITLDFSALSQNAGKNNTGELTELNKIYSLSKTGKNVIVIMLDRAIPGYVPYIFEEKPDLLKSFKGFTYYPNSVSFGGHTVFGAPGLFGGYYYTPLEIQKRSDELLVNKYTDSMRVLPRLFSENSFTVTISDQPNIKNELYSDYPDINIKNVKGKYTYHFLSRHDDLKDFDYSEVLHPQLIRFSFFEFSPLILREFIYDDGKYLNVNFRQPVLMTTIDSYASLDFLSEITDITEENENFCIIFDNILTHEPAFFQAPDYVPVFNVTDKGSGPFSEESHYHVNMAAFLLLDKWFSYLKQNEVYDNTRIIIVSDHGLNIHSSFLNNIQLPNGDELEFYNVLLMVKDFNAGENLQTDYQFMTNADVPFLAANEIIENPKDPFTGKDLKPQKEGGVTITTSHIWANDKQGKFIYTIKKDEWLHVHDDIFKPENWTKITKQY
ncbi:MAG: YidC/Oxa1 family membrane protein insertase [Treponema sp.]|jgi:YidC/Oxa1 family membrane protein insertase|nr:YidC/Oxa1 family membrane protein insertase [Treponema sp.]